MRYVRNHTLVLLISAFILIPTAVWSQTTQADSQPHKDTFRNNALDLYKKGKFIDALPLLEHLTADNPKDLVVKEAYAWCLVQDASTLPDVEQQKKVRIHARQVAVEAKELGDNSQLLQMILELPPDGGTLTYSDNKEVDEAMKAAEANFSRGDFDGAIQGYQQVLKVDPKNYDAALFTGDVYFKQKAYDRAGEWFARAIEIDSSRETAYRYWGDALFAKGSTSEARDKYINAVIAEPYNNHAWIGLTNWLQHYKLTLNDIRLHDRANIAQKDPTHINITLDSSFKKDDPNSTAWTAYALGRASWRGERFKKEFPNESQYRHSLKEEVDCFELMISSLRGQKDYEKNISKLDPSLQSLIDIERRGFLDPFILLNRADNDIAKDYEPYRTAHRDVIEHYLSDFVVPEPPVQTKNAIDKPSLP